MSMAVIGQTLLQCERRVRAAGFGFAFTARGGDTETMPAA